MKENESGWPVRIAPVPGDIVRYRNDMGLNIRHSNKIGILIEIVEAHSRLPFGLILWSNSRQMLEILDFLEPI